MNQVKKSIHFDFTHQSKNQAHFFNNLHMAQTQLDTREVNKYILERCQLFYLITDINK